MPRHTPSALAMFPHLRGTSYTEDGIGIFRDHHATSKVEEQKAMRAEARRKKKLKLARKKARNARKVSVKVTVEVHVEVTVQAPCRCTYDAKQEVLDFENNPYAMAYRRRSIY